MTHDGRARHGYGVTMDFRWDDDRGAAGFSWIAMEPMTRTSHALADSGRVWLVDPVDWPDAIERAATLGTPAAVIQLLGRHNRDGRAIAERLGVPHLRVPRELPGTPFAVVEVKQTRHWQEVAIWWPQRRTLVVAEALGTNAFFPSGDEPVGVHGLLKATPPRMLAALEPEHLLVGHGAGLHGPEVADAIAHALSHSRLSIASWAASVPLRWRRLARERR